ncbi:MAG: GNAT family N-acetyltransferase [Pseudomonadota bacterium]
MTGNPLKRFWMTILHGNLVEALLFRLQAAGITIAPYYLVRYGIRAGTRTPGGNVCPACTYGFLGSQDMKSVAALISWPSTEEEWQVRLGEGKLCFATWCENQVIACIWVDLDVCKAKWATVNLQPHEAYLFALCTREDFRGRQIAQHLIVHCQRALGEMGRKTLYSHCSIVNRSSVKFFRRLGATFLKRGVYIDLFGHIRVNIPL